MTWNYRIIKRVAKDEPRYYYALNEVFYQETGELMAFSDSDTIVASSPEEIIKVLKMMLADAKKNRPILSERDFKNE